MAQQTAVEWLIEQLRQLAHNPSTHLGMGDIRVTQGMLDDLEEQAKQMENEEIIKRTLDVAEDTADYVDKVIIKALVEDMHKQPLTFVSKEISDEEIEEQSKYWNETTNPDMWTFKLAWKAGAKWYKKQLKNK